MKQITLNKKLSALHTFLKSASFYKEAYILALAVSEGVMPDFAWLDNGLMLGLKRAAGEAAFNEFIELNSDKFAVWNPVKYLGSGMVGSAWLLDDGKVLKIFDGSASVFFEGDYSKYERIMEDQFEGKSNPNVPMIYELGDLEMPDKFYSVRSPSKKSSGYFDAKYVIMESLETPDQMVREHIAWNPYLTEPAFEYNEEDDEWVEREVDQTKEILRMDRSEVPPDLLGAYDEAITYDDYETFLNQFVTFMWNHIISAMSMAYEYEEEKDEDEEGSLNPSDPNYKEFMIDSLESSMGWSDYYDDESLEALERILNVTPGWRRRLAQSVFDNLQMDRQDLHGENFGFRNGKFVFFDA